MKVEVIVHPNNKNPRIEKDLTGQIHVYVSAPPLEGKANKAVRQALAKYLEAKENKVVLIKGLKAKRKVFEVDS